MTSIQKSFLKLLKGRMENGEPEKPIFDFIQARIKQPRELWDCLEAFITVSAKYGIERKSMQVFWGLVANVLAWCEPYYALELEYRVRPEADSQWSVRFAALYADWKKEALERIARQKKKATPIDFRRLERLKGLEEDIDAAKKAKPAAKRALSADAKRFCDVFHRYMATKTKAARLELDKVIESLSGEPLERCLQAYLEASERYSPTDAFSLYAFFGMSSRALHKCSGYFALKFEQWINPASKSTWAKRYAKLDRNQLTQLGTDLKLAKARTRILDELRFAYYKVHEKDPSDRALREFEAIKNDDLRREVSGALAEYFRDCSANNVRGFTTSWDRFTGLLAKKDRMTMTMMVKWCRDWLTGERAMRDELYWNALGALLGQLLRDRATEYDPRGFNAEEKAYFVGSNRARHPYIGDFEYRLRFLWTTRQVGQFAQISKTHAGLIIYASKRNMRLATMDETATVYGKLEAMWKHGPKSDDIRSISVTQPEGMLKDRNTTVSLGDLYGDLSIVWFGGHDTAYLECTGLEKVLFVMHETVYSHELGRLTTARFYDKLIEGTQGLQVLLPYFFLVLSYLPDLVTGGLTGLVKSIVLQHGIETWSELMLGDTDKAKIFASSMSMATGRLAHAESTATKNISADLRAANALEHGAFSARGLPVAQGRLGIEVPSTTKQSVRGGAGELPSLGVHPITRPRGGTAVDAITTSRVSTKAPPRVDPKARVDPSAPSRTGPVATPRTDPAPNAPAVRPAPATAKPTKSDKHADIEAREQRELVASRAGGKGAPRKKGSERGDDGGKGPPPEPPAKPPAPSAPPTKPGRGKGDVADDRGKSNRGKSESGVPPPQPPRSPKPPPVEPTYYATPTFVRNGIPYCFVGTLDDFNALQSLIPTRFQVYVIKDASGRMVYVGITGGETRALNALDRLRQHLYTKKGEFVGDAAWIEVRGRNLDERVARGLEDHLIDARNPHWNNRERDPQSYVRKYGQKPPIEEVRAAQNANLRFRIDLLPTRPPTR